MVPYASVLAKAYKNGSPGSFCRLLAVPSIVKQQLGDKNSTDPLAVAPHGMRQVHPRTVGEMGR
ncbi:hypothetical protein GCM10027404_13700 [Arthrobacter tumbae]